MKLKAKSFAVPGIEPGAIIEYRWKEIRGSVNFYQRLNFSREIPMEVIKYYVKPIPNPDYSMFGQPYNLQNAKMTPDKNGFYSTTVTNIPSFKEESRMPPEFAVRPWVLLYYVEGNQQKTRPREILERLRSKDL